MFEVNDFCVDLVDAGTRLPVVRNVSFQIGEGQVLGLIGESGSGKTVTGLSIAGIHQAPKWNITGSVSLDGEKLCMESDDEMRKLRGSKICFVMQNPMSAFDPLFTIQEHFQETQAAHGNKDKAATNRLALNLLERMRIDDPQKVLKSYPFECSGGMLQRIMIAIAVMNRPKLLIADEPTTALDRTVQYEIIRILGELKEMGSAILFISHDLKAVNYIADEIAVMYGGYVVERGLAREVMENPMHPYTQALIGAAPAYSKELLPVLDGLPPSLHNRTKSGCPFAARCSVKLAGCESYNMNSNRAGNHEYRCIRSF